jgi:hypothetical protein
MPILTDSQLLDLVKGTLTQMDPPNWEDVAQDLQRYEVMGRWMKKDRLLVGGGRSIERFVMTDLPDAARHVGHLEEDQINLVDVMTSIEVPFVLITTNYPYFRQEIEDNAGKALVFNVLKPRRHGTMIDLASKLETYAWSEPDATDPRLPYSVPYWVTMHATQGFNGAAATGFSTKGGINPTTVPTWKNWTDTYSLISYGDLVEKLDIMTLSCHFTSPVAVPTNRKSLQERYRIYCGLTTYIALKRLYRGQNDNLGWDLGMDDGNLVIKGHPIVWVPKLDGDTTYYRVFALDHNSFYPVVKKGDNFRETEPRWAPLQHNTLIVHVDHRYNYICMNPRCNGVLYKV